LARALYHLEICLKQLTSRKEKNIAMKLSRKEIRKMIDRKKKERKDYSSDRIALLKLAKDLCVEFSK